MCSNKQDYWNTNGRDLFRECLLEGIEIALTEKANKIYKALHILCPAFMIATIFYVLINGFVR